MQWDVSKGLEGLDHNFITGKLEDLVKWARRMSVMPATFGLACCAIEMMGAGGAHYDISRFGMETFRAKEVMRKMSDAISAVLGPALIADSGEWGTYAWAEHVLGAPGYRIAGGSDEVQRNILGERLLGLPAEPRVDRDTPFSLDPRRFGV